MLPVKNDLLWRIQARTERKRVFEKKMYSPHWQKKRREHARETFRMWEYTIFVHYLRSATSSSRKINGIVGLGGKGWQSNSMTAKALGRRPDGGGQWLTPREPPLFPLPSKYHDVRKTKRVEGGWEKDCEEGKKLRIEGSGIVDRAERKLPAGGQERGQ